MHDFLKGFAQSIFFFLSVLVFAMIFLHLALKFWWVGAIISFGLLFVLMLIPYYEGD